jgi:hypothetical protein
MIKRLIIYLTNKIQIFIFELTLSEGSPLPFDVKRVGPSGTPITGLHFLITEM